MANRLARATSPYLLQHAENPVDWYEWGPEAFAEAGERDVPIFLSVGYAACHWCHVMAHESFEDSELAAELNEHFVPVKVDREERPDVDAVYMQATQSMTGQGGWPMSVFLTPDGKPFYAGTYFPPRPAHGMPSFGQLLSAVSVAWRDRRNEVDRSAGDIAAKLAASGPLGTGPPVDGAAIGEAVRRLAADFDPDHAGFGTAPKFPPSMVLEALLREDSPAARTMVDRTCDSMARGGIYDQLAGGFARYSVDAGWVVPHFEKMLYDNALLLGVYTHLWRRRPSPLAERVVAETVEWLVAEMRTPEGGFAASLDADSVAADGDHREGAYYVWTPDALRAVLSSEDATWAADLLDVTEMGTFEHGLSTLQLRRDPEDPERWRWVRSRLAAARSTRARPARDDKVVAAWNGLLVDALVQAAEVFDRPGWRDHAVDAARLLWEVHVVDRRLRRTSRGGRVGAAPAVLEDYAALVLAFTRLAASTADAAWLDRARQLAEVVMSDFDDGAGGFFDTARDSEQLYARPQDPTDNATPSGLSATVHALRLLAELTGETRFTERADEAAAVAAQLVTAAPRFAGWLLADAVSVNLQPPLAVALVCGEDSDDPERARRMRRTAHREVPAGSVVVCGNPDQPGFVLFADRPARQGRTTAYVCRDFVCRLPVTDADALSAEVRGSAAV